MKKWGILLVTNNEEFYYLVLIVGYYNKTRCKQEITKNHLFYKYTVTGKGLKYRIYPLVIVIVYEIFKDFYKYLNIKNFKPKVY